MVAGPTRTVDEISFRNGRALQMLTFRFPFSGCRRPASVGGRSGGYQRTSARPRRRFNGRARLQGGASQGSCTIA